MASSKNNIASSSNESQQAPSDQLVRELDALYDFCKENRISDEEIRQIFSPLLQIVNRSQALKRLKTCLAIFLVVSVLLYAIYSNADEISWHLSAIGRILMIKALPLCDWTSLKDERCLISWRNGQNAEDNKAGNSGLDCVSCEAITNIEILEDYNNDIEDELYENYIKLHVPVVLRKSVETWKIFNVSSMSNVTDLLMSNEVLANSLPCKVSTNTNPRYASATLKELLNGIDRRLRSFFLHFQNCEFDAVKHFRVLAWRPQFLHPEIAPIQYSWLIASRSYDVRRFKNVDLQDNVAVVGQILGTGAFNLVPRNECLDECFTVEVELDRGDALVLTSLWNLEYKPSTDGDSISVVLETH